MLSAMIRLAPVLALAALVLGVSQAGARNAGCLAGVRSVGGISERMFCGPAKATVHFGSHTFSFANGDCVATSTYLSVNIGTVVLGETSKPKPNYFGVDVGRTPGSTTKPAGKDGTYPAAALALDYGGKGYLATGVSVVLSGNRSHGTLSGTPFGSSGAVTGTFSC
jgi:hypothetical protein